ncbi:hypothetical protein DV738_g5534, partial [Chaetothyriales sp. CBS 135597]
MSIVEGGTHKGGSSRNKLIVFSDGTYLELFSWISKPVDFAHWADKPPGLIDFALTTLRPFDAQKTYKAVQANLSRPGGDGDLGVRLSEPQAGGRETPDGREVRWQTTRAQYTQGKNTPPADFFPTGRIDTPFFCHDLTPRVVRVPFDNEELTTHPSKAQGVAGVDVLVPSDKLTHYSDLYSSFVGEAPQQLDHSTKKGVFFKLTTPTSQGSGPVITVRVPTSEEDEQWIKERGVGIREIQLSVSGQTGHGEKPLGDGIASTVSLKCPFSTTFISKSRHRQTQADTGAASTMSEQSRTATPSTDRTESDDVDWDVEDESDAEKFGQVADMANVLAIRALLNHMHVCLMNGDLDKTEALIQKALQFLDKVQDKDRSIGERIAEIHQQVAQSADPNSDPATGVADPLFTYLADDTRKPTGRPEQLNPHEGIDSYFQRFHQGIPYNANNKTCSCQPTDFWFSIADWRIENHGLDTDIPTTATATATFALTQPDLLLILRQHTTTAAAATRTVIKHIPRRGAHIIRLADTGTKR